MRYFIFLYLLLFHTSDVMAQLDIRLGEIVKSQNDSLPIEQEEDNKEDFSSQVFKRNIYGRYDDSKKKINVENKVSKTILRPREDFKDRIKNSLGKY